MSDKEASGPSSGEDTGFTLHLVQALKDPQVAAQFRNAMAPLITPLHDALQQNTAQIGILRAQLAERDDTIQNLQSHVQALEIKIDDLEQHGRKGSIRVFGLPEDSPGTLEDKLLSLFNDNVKVVPPLTLNDIEVAHRLGKPPHSPPTQTPPVPRRDDGVDGEDGDSQADAVQQSATPAVSPKKHRSVIVKFESRRTKALVMDNRKNLKDNPFEYQNGSTAKIYISDDLTKRRAQLAFQARNLKRQNAILDTWIFEGRILIKDKHRKISQVNSQEDLRKF